MSFLFDNHDLLRMEESMKHRTTKQGENIHADAVVFSKS